MKQGITVVTWKGGRDEALNLIHSMDNVKYPILVVINDGLETTWMDSYIDIQVVKLPTDSFEIGAIKATLEHTDWDEFVLLQDTFEIKNVDVFRKLFENYPGHSVAYNPHFQMYLGKFRRSVLEQLSLPTVETKLDAIRQEGLFTKSYKLIEPVSVFNPEFVDPNFYGNWEEKWGRRNLRLEDDYIIKRKGTWTMDQISAAVELR